ncbi:hypothetical protein LguiA_030054 [Lonicera macranthoides]
MNNKERKTCPLRRDGCNGEVPSSIGGHNQADYFQEGALKEKIEILGTNATVCSSFHEVSSLFLYLYVD